MFKKFFFTLLLVGIGACGLYFLSQKAIDTEKRFFQDLFIKNNKDFALLVGRQLAEELLQVKKRMESFANVAQKAGLDHQKLKEHFRYNFEADQAVVAIQFHDYEKDELHEFFSISAHNSKNSFAVKNKAQREELYKRDQDLFTQQYDVRSRPFLSWFQIIRDRRQNKTLGSLEARISLDSVFQLALAVMETRGGSILLAKRDGTVITPKGAGWKFLDEEVSMMRKSFVGGFQRNTKSSEELVSFCALKLLNRVHMPDWVLLVIQDPQEMERVSSRLRWNIYALMMIGVLCLLLLSRLVIWR